MFKEYQLVMIYCLESWWMKHGFFLNKVLFWALTKSHRLLKRYQPIDSIENLRMLSFLLFNMRTVSQFQFPRLDIFQSNCQHHCGLLFILSASWQSFWFTQHWKVSGEAYILSIPLSNSWQILFSKWSGGMKIGLLKPSDFPAWVLFKS